MRHEESLYLRWTAAETRCRALARHLYGRVRAGHTPTEAELRELAEASANACALFREHLTQVLAQSGESPTPLLPVDQPPPTVTVAECPTCARIADEPANDWEAELDFLGADRRTRRVLHFHCNAASAAPSGVSPRAGPPERRTGAWPTNGSSSEPNAVRRRPLGRRCQPRRSEPVLGTCVGSVPCRAVSSNVSLPVSGVSTGLSS